MSCRRADGALCQNLNPSTIFRVFPTLRSPPTANQLAQCKVQSVVRMSSPKEEENLAEKHGPSSLQVARVDELEVIEGQQVVENNSNNETEDIASNSPTSATGICAKCSKRKAREGCTQTCCVQCCEDSDCQVHKKAKEQRHWREQVLAGTTEIQRFAAEKRRQKLAGRWREPAFVYMGETIVLWDLRAYMKNLKWKEDAIRKSRRRLVTQLNDGVHATSSVGGRMGHLRNSRRRFARIMEELYQKTLQDNSSSNT